MTPAHRPGPRGDPLADPDWDRKISQLPAASFFHGSAWARVLHDTYGFQPAYLTRTAGGELRGLLPFMEADSWLTGRRGISLPFTDHCAPLAAEDAIVGDLAAEATGLAATRRWKYWEVRGGTRALGAPASVAFHGHTLTLDSPPAELFTRCDSAVRRAVRKAAAGEITITFAHDLAAIRAFHQLLCQTRRRHGLPPQPFRFFENIQRHVLAQKHGCVVLAHVAGRAVAGAVFLHFGRTALFKFGASDHAFQHLRPNNLVLWRAIEWHARAGFVALDLGRTSLANEGLRRFKLSWGAAERRLEYARFDCRAAAFVTAPDRSSGWHSRLFRLLPPAVSRLVGTVAYRHIA
jgi:hypothetical protein